MEKLSCIVGSFGWPLNPYKSKSQKYAAQQYESMSPGRIVLALFDGVLVRIQRAVDALDAGDIASRGEALDQALKIIAQLQASLDTEKGGQVGVALYNLYTFVTHELARGNLQDDREAFSYCGSLIQEVRDGWAEMLETQDYVEPKKPIEGGGYL